MSSRPLDLTGEKYGKLTALKRIPQEHTTICKWLCECDCGSKVEVSIANLRGKGRHTKSCGCLRKESAQLKDDYHGLTKTRCYKSWCKIKERCYNAKDQDYYNYGAKGIVMCDEWLNDFKNFYEYLGESPAKGYSVDRINSKGNYEPGNIKWSTTSEQARNKSKQSNNTSGVSGVQLDNKSVKGGDPKYYYKAAWRSLDGKTRAKSYSVEKYGKEKAFELAVAKRKEMIEYLNSLGAGYSETHGI